MTPPAARVVVLITALTVGALAACTSGDHPDGRHATAARPPAAPTSMVGAPASAAAVSPSGAGAAGTRPLVRVTRSPSSSVASAPYPTPSGGRVPVLHRDQASVLESLPGSRTPACAVVGSRVDVRSGDVAAGNFVLARRSYAHQVPVTEVPTVFLYLIPEHAGSSTKATVGVAALASGRTQTVTSRRLEDAGEWRYFALDIPVRAPGTYRLTMVAGDDRGCFEVTFRK